MKLYLIIPKVGSTLKSPIIGSGKIKRRCIVKPFKYHKSFRSDEFSFLVKKKNIIPIISDRSKSRKINFKNSATKIIFNYWNSLSHPFIRHRDEWNKTTSFAIDKINQVLKSDGKEKIIYSIQIINSMFKSDWFKYRIIFSKKKISLPDFFRYSNSSFKEINRQIKDVPRSWYKECLKGENYLKSKFSIKLKNKYPSIVKKFIDIWKVYCTINLKSGVRINNDIIIISKLLYEFCKVNNFDWMIIIDIIDKMINDWKSYKPKHLGYFRSEIFWNDTLPKEIIRFGIVDKNMKWINIL